MLLARGVSMGLTDYRRSKAVLTAALLLIVFASLMSATAIGAGNGLVDKGEAEKLRVRLKAWRELIRRILNATVDVPRDVLERAELILNLTDPEIEGLSPSDLEKYFVAAKELFRELKPRLRRHANATRIAEEAKIRESLKIARKIASKLGALKAIPAIENATELLNKGKIRRAFDVLRRVEQILRERKVNCTSMHVNKLLDKLVEKIGKYNKTERAVIGIKIAIFNLNRTMGILARVKELLQSVNASEKALEAIDRAIQNIAGTRELLSSISEYINITVPKPGHALRKAIRKAIAEKVNDTLSEVREELLELIDETGRLIELAEEGNRTEMVKALLRIGGSLNKLWNATFEIEKLINEGNYTHAVRALANIRMAVEKLEKQIDVIEEMLKSVEEIFEDLKDKLEELKDKIAEFKEKLSELIEEAEEHKVMPARKFLKMAKELISRAEHVVKQIEKLIEDRRAAMAKALIKSLDRLVNAIEKYIERAEEFLEEH